MSDTSVLLRQQTIVTLAAALIVSRGAKSLQEANDALEDAKYLLHPKPDEKQYQEWLERRGESVVLPPLPPPMRFSGELLDKI